MADSHEVKCENGEDKNSDHYGTLGEATTGADPSAEKATAKLTSTTTDVAATNLDNTENPETTTTTTTTCATTPPPQSNATETKPVQSPFPVVPPPAPLFPTTPATGNVPYPHLQYATAYPPPSTSTHAPHYWSTVGTVAVASGGSSDAAANSRPGATSPSQIEHLLREDAQHMGCTCKKTRCLKMYCQCFTFKIFCGRNCRCANCHNTKDNEEARQDAIRLILTRNPNAFDAKFQKTMDANKVMAAAAISQEIQVGETTVPPPTLQATAEAAKVLAHKLGCKCRKSNCMKKYCECFAGNVKCTPHCRCVGCKNMADGYPAPSGAPPSAPQFSTLLSSSVTTDESGRRIPSSVPQQYGHPSSAIMTIPPTIFQHLHPSQVMQKAQKATSAFFSRHPTNTTSGGDGDDGSKTSTSTGQAVPPIQAARDLAYLKEHGSAAAAAAGTTPTLALQPQQHATSPEGGVSALMLAAYAMTEYGQGSLSTRSTRRRQQTAANGNTNNNADSNNDNGRKRPRDDTQQEALSGGSGVAALEEPMKTYLEV
ncbi:hypothetical protein ACA910_019121 [Epithemia clementina (nom. ined.)]